MLLGFGQVLLFRKRSQILLKHWSYMAQASELARLFQDSGYVSHQPSSSAKNGLDVPSWDLRCHTRACSSATLVYLFI